MKPRAIDVLLMAVILAGGVLAWRTGRERSRLSARYENLARVTGELPVVDASKVHVRALDTGEPLHYAWRVYLPPKYNSVLKDNAGDSSSSWSNDASEAIVRVRFRRNERGLLEVYIHSHGASSRGSFGDQAVADLLLDPRGLVRVEQLGEPDLAVLERGKPAVLVRLSVPEGNRDEVRRSFPNLAERFLPVVYELTLGPEPSKP